MAAGGRRHVVAVRSAAATAATAARWRAVERRRRRAGVGATAAAGAGAVAAVELLDGGKTGHVVVALWMNTVTSCVVLVNNVPNLNMEQTPKVRQV